MSMRKIIKFFLRYFFKHPMYCMTYCIAYFQRDFTFRTTFLSEDQVRFQLQKGKSIIRLGDGEINLLLDIKNHYQEPSVVLKSMLKEIILSYSSSSRFILSVPRFIGYSNDELKNIRKFNVWLPFKAMFFLLFPKKVSYMDAHNFYYDGYFEKIIKDCATDKLIFIITKKETLEKHKNNTTVPWGRTVYIETPESNALSRYDTIKNELNNKLLGVDSRSVLLLVAIGPIGKYLVYEYASKGYQGIDVGKGIETMFTSESIEHLSI